MGLRSYNNSPMKEDYQKKKKKSKKKSKVSLEITFLENIKKRKSKT